MSLKVFASLIIAGTMLVSCSSKTKTTTATTKTSSTTSTSKPVKSTTKVTTTANASAIVCKSGSDTRTLEVVTKDTGCELSYTKFDQTSTPATSRNGTAYCESVKEKIKGNLETSGFKCE